MKYFCSKCGKTTQYNFELPKFCAFCGQLFASNSKSSAEADGKRNKFLNELKLKKNINPVEIVEIEENEESYISESSLDFKKVKPSFKVDVYQSRGESFGSLIDNPSAPIEVQNQNSVETKTREEILAEFQREAGSLRSE